MDNTRNPEILKQEKAGLQSEARMAGVWLLIGLIIGLIAGYLFFALRNDDMEQRYNDHLIEEHGGKHPAV